MPGQDTAQKLTLPAANIDDAPEAREIEHVHDGFEKTTGHFGLRRSLWPVGTPLPQTDPM